MKTLLLIILLVLSLVSCAERQILWQQLQDRNGIYYVLGETEPYSGKSTQFYPNGQLMWEGTYENGEANGLHRIWNEKGQLLSETKYVNGKANESIVSLFVGVWTGQTEIDVGRVLSWKQTRKPDGSYKIEFNTHLDGDLIGSSDEEGQWWVKNGYFYEQNNTNMKTPDIYLYKILNEQAIKFISVWVDETAITYSANYEFIGYKQ